MEEIRKKRQKGASLMFVIIAVAFVGILATIVTRLVVINVNVKSVDRQTKKNFYSAESVMDEVDIAVESLTADAMKTAYVEIMSNYVNTAYSTTDQNSIQVRFAYLYLKKLVETLSNTNYSIAADYTMDASATYDIQIIKKKMEDLLTADEGGKCWQYVEDTIKNPNLVLKFDATSGGERSLTLKNVKVVYYEKDRNGNKKSTWLKTDIKISAPNLSFESGNIYPEFTKYSIIGDDRVSASNQCKDDIVNGSVYAGHKGLSVEGYSGDVKDTKGETLTIGGSGTKVITRGNVEVVQGGRLSIGTDASDVTVWTENLNTVAGASTSRGSTAPAKLTVYGDAYVHDDLSINSPYSLVSYLSGRYYGYTFNRDNSTKASAYVNSNYSSAIVLNGKHSSLYMGDSMQSILLGGQAYVSRKNWDTNSGSKKDILLGQSLSVKSDQKFYMVNNDDLADGFTNPMSWQTYQTYIADSTKGTKISGGRIPLVSEKYKQLKNLLDKTEPITTYVVSMTQTSGSANAAMVYLYYNFKNSASANTYFKQYVKNEDLLERMVSSEYLKFDGDFNGLDIDMSSNLAVFAKGSLITHVEENKLETTDGNINDSTEVTLMSDSIRYASQYKSYQLTLTDGNWTEYSANANTQGYKAFDLYNDGTVNLKETDTIFESLLSKTDDDSEYDFIYDAKSNPGNNGYEELSGYEKAMIKIVPVNIGSGNVYAIFVAQLNDANVSTVAVPTDVLLNKAKAVGFNETDANNYNVMIVSNGKISVNTDIHGIVISDTEVQIHATNKIMTAAPAALQAMFSAQKSQESGGSTPKTDFLTYFKCFENLTFGADESAVDVLDISQCISHANWKKNEEE